MIDQDEQRKKGLNYTKRIIAFIDILGFSEKVKLSITDNDLRLKIYNILKMFNQMTINPDFYNSKIEDNASRKVSSFSDLIVLTYSEKCSFLEAIYDLLSLQMECIKQGFLIRGGIDLGEIYHTSDVVFGPGLISSYSIETRNAIYPRICFTEEVLNKSIIGNGFKTIGSPFDDLESIKSYVKKDQDGMYYIDFLSIDALAIDFTSGRFMIQSLENIISVKQNCIEYQQKQDWLSNKIKTIN